MNTTHLLYLEDFNLLHCTATVVNVISENDRTMVILDQTVFYPQGGGQPFDQGIIESETAKFLVKEVRFVDGIVKHIGNFEQGNFSVGQQVTCLVDKVRRALNSRLHSAGHVVDMAVTALNFNWVPGKGFHFPEGPYVEYTGSLEGCDKEKIKNDIEALCNKFIHEAHATRLVFMPKEEMHKVCHFVPDYLPAGKPSRVVLYGEFGVPCGGTHVSNLGDIKSMTIRKVKDEKGNIRVSYDVVR